MGEAGLYGFLQHAWCGYGDLAPIGVAKYDTIEDQMPADPTREGYVFAGWYTDEAYTVPSVATQQIVRNLTLHAKWTRTDSCTHVIVAKDTEGNELKRVDGSEVEVGASVIKCACH